MRTVHGWRLAVRGGLAVALLLVALSAQGQTRVAVSIDATTHGLTGTSTNLFKDNIAHLPAGLATNLVGAGLEVVYDAPTRTYQLVATNITQQVNYNAPVTFYSTNVFSGPTYVGVLYAGGGGGSSIQFGSPVLLSQGALFSGGTVTFDLSTIIGTSSTWRLPALTLVGSSATASGAWDFTGATITGLGGTAGIGAPTTGGFATVTTTSGGTNTISVDGTKVAVLASNNTFNGNNTFNNPVIIRGTMIFSNDVAISGHTTMASNLTVGGTLTVGNFSAAQINSGTLSANRLPDSGVVAGSYGSSSQIPVITVDGHGIITVAGTAAPSPTGAATNAVSTVVFFPSTTNANIVTMIFTNLSVTSSSAQTVTVGFVNRPIETINGMPGQSVTISNSTTLSSAGGLLINGLQSSGGASFVVGGTATISTNAFSGTSGVVLTIPALGQAVLLQPSANVNSVLPQVSILPLDGSNFQGINFARNGNKDGSFQFISWSDASSGALGFGLWNESGSGGKTRHVRLSTSPSAGGNIFVTQDGMVGSSSTTEYEFWGNNGGFPRILFAGKAHGQTTTNTAHLFENYASFGSWTNSGGGALIITGSNQTWLVAAGRASGSTSGTQHKMYPTNAVSGFLAFPRSSVRSNQTAVCLLDETNGTWALTISTNGVYIGRTNNPTANTILAGPLAE
jgi:hypothetical protein